VDDKTEERAVIRNPGYELFILGLSIFSIFNIVIALLANDPEIVSIVEIIDGLSCIIFLGDFAYRLITAPDRRAYMKWGWLDFLGSLPFPGLRLLRTVRIVRVVRGMELIGGPAILRTLLRDRAGSAVLAVFLITIVVLEFSAILMVIAERGNPDANIKTGGDALWWALVSVTTVGYGDRYPVTVGGRFVGVVTLVVGIGLFSTITGFLATKLARSSSSEPIPPPPLSQEAREAGNVIDRSAEDRPRAGTP
jgi:voltage-gated potassium channel Kch